MIFHLIISIGLFISAVFGIFFSRRNVIMIIMCLEVLLLSINYNFVFFSQILDDIMGQVVSLLILSISAVESALGLSIIISYYKFYI